MDSGVRFAATPEERSAVYRLRYRIYVEEMDRFADQADHERRELRDAYDATARSLLAVTDGEPVATLRMHWGGDAPFADAVREAYVLERFAGIVREEQMVVAERMMVPRDRRGAASLTSQLYFALYRFVVEQGVELVLLDCEPHLINNWLKLGFRPFAPTFTYPGVGLVVPLVGVVWDLEHLRRVGSPLLMALGENADPAPHAETVHKVLALLPEGAPVISERATGADSVIGAVYHGLEAASEDRPFIFDDMSEAEVTRVLERSHVIECRPGDVLIKRGNTARTLFVLLSGVVEVRRDGKLVAVLAPGAVIGEVAFLLGKPRTADVVAATDDVRVLTLNDTSIRRQIRADSALAAKLLLNLCRCLCARMLEN